MNKTIQLIQSFALHGVKDIVTTDIIRFLQEDSNPIQIDVVQDARSAAFNALGKTKMSGLPVLLMLDEAYIASIYTSLTETWFQQEHIIVIAYNSNLYKHNEYLDRCILGSFHLLDDTDIERLVNKSLALAGPVLIKVAEDFCPQKKCNYDDILSILGKYVTSKDILFCYNTVSDDICKIKNISKAHKYCVISKYVGYMLGCKESKGYLCIPEYLLGYDTNILNFRDIPSSLKIIVKADESGIFIKINKWIEENNILVTDDISSLVVSCQPSIAYIK